jgi:transposase-like protein
MTAYEKVICVYCGNDNLRKFGKRKGKQRYQCKSGCGKTFQSGYTYEARKPGVHDKVIDMAVNGNGIRDTARVLKISTGAVMRTIKKSQ